MKDSTAFILIDDDPMNHLICQMTIEVVLGCKEIKTFINPAVAFEFITTEYPKRLDSNVTTILLLDLSMPIMSGWEFLERFDNLSTDIKSSINLYILSSSIDERDKERSYANKNVKGYLLKPLTKESLNQIAKGVARVIS